MHSTNENIDEQDFHPTKSRLVNSLFDDELSDELLQQKIAAAISAPLKTNHSEIHYGLTIAGCNLLFEKGLYCEVIDFTAPARLPNTPQHFLGLCNLRGNLIPVYQLTRDLDTRPPKSGAHKSSISNTDIANPNAVNPNTVTTKFQYIFIVNQKDYAAAIALEQLPQRVDLEKLEKQDFNTVKLNSEQSNTQALDNKNPSIKLISQCCNSYYQSSHTLWHMIDSKELFKQLAKKNST